MSNVSTEAKKAEALGRMTELGVNNQVIRRFAGLGEISISEPPFGGLTRIDGEDLKRVREFERQFNALVFTVHSQLHEERNNGQLLVRQ